MLIKFRSLVLSCLIALLVPALTAQAREACGPDTPEVRIDVGNGPLAGAQDIEQTSSGCYMESAALLLQGSLPGSPEISVLDLYLNEQELYLSKTKTPNLKTLQTTNSGGSTWVLLRRSNEKNGFCARSSVPIEAYGATQSRTHLARMIQLLDMYQYQMNDEERAKWREVMHNSEDFWREAIRTDWVECNICRSIKNKLKAEFHGEREAQYTKEKMQALTRAADYFIQDKYIPLLGKNPAPTNEEIYSLLKSFLKTSGMPTAVSQGITGIKKFTIEEIETDLKNGAAVANSYRLQKRSDEICPVCHTNLKIGDIRNEALGLSKNLSSLKETADQVTSLYSEPGDAFQALQKAISPKCSEPSNRIRLPKNFSVQYEKVEQYATKPVAKTPEEVTKWYRDIVLSRLKGTASDGKPRPVAVSFCYDALESTTYDGKYMSGMPYCERRSHSSIILGYRYNPAKSSCEYLLETFSKDVCIHNPTVDCPDGVKSKAWVNESRLIRNSGELITLEPTQR